MELVIYSARIISVRNKPVLFSYPGRY